MTSFERLKISHPIDEISFQEVMWFLELKPPISFDLSKKAIQNHSEQWEEQAQHTGLDNNIVKMQIISHIPSSPKYFKYNSTAINDSK